MRMLSKLIGWMAILVYPACSSLLVPIRTTAILPYSHPKSYYESRVDLNEPEQFRIRKHLSGVEADLRDNPPKGLTSNQIVARAKRLDDLHEYWVRGEFPQNPDYPDSLVPYFIDAKGVACAVGQLVIASGHGEFANYVARSQNHAYIREITDPRLAAWAEQSGLTLEECARIQPAYGGPTPYPYIREIEVNRLGQIWTSAGGNLLVFPQPYRTIYWNAGSWIMQNSSQWNQHCMCLDPLGRPLVGLTGGVFWNGQVLNDPGANSFACAWSRGGSMVWVAGNFGFTTYVLNGTTLLLQSRPQPRESTFVVATTLNLVWGGSSRGLLRGIAQAPSGLTRIDSTGMGSSRITGVVGGNGDSVWVGLNGKYGNEQSGSSFGMPPSFSGKGLLYGNGVNWTFYNREKSGLPSDTVQAMTPADNQSVWIAFAAGIYKFTPPATLIPVLNPLGAPVTDMTTDTVGRLYIATWGRGVYRLANDSLTALGFLTVPSAIFSGNKPITSKYDALKILIGRSDFIPLHTLLGRKTGTKIASGVYVIPNP